MACLTQLRHTPCGPRVSERHFQAGSLVSLSEECARVFWGAVVTLSPRGL